MNKKINFITLLVLFFRWGFVTCLNDILTYTLKGMFTLSNFQANFVSFAFFIAYFMGSLFFVLSALLGIKFFIRLGFKGLIILGLILSGLGCLVFIPASLFTSYPLFLSGLFLIGFGFTFLQIAANPLVIIIGAEKTSASRLNLAGGFNSLATTLAPIVGVHIFDSLLQVHTHHHNLKYPYIFLALFFGLLLILIHVALHTNKNHTFSQETNKPLALNHANLFFGMFAIFFYVGAEVSIGTHLISYLTSVETVALDHSISGKLLAFYWGGAMIGRFLAGVALSGINSIKKLLSMIVLSVVLTWLIIFTTDIGDLSISYYIGFQVIAITLFMFVRNSRSNLILFSIINIINLIIGASMHNSWFAVWAVLSIGIFNSVMWPNIFDLAISGLGKYKEQGASFLVMMILGGAIIPLLQGHVADQTHIVISFLIPAIGYIYILGYGIFYSKKKLIWFKAKNEILIEKIPV